MAGKAAATQSTVVFEIELLVEDPDRLRIVVATRNPVSHWIDPATLKLRHRFGEGAFPSKIIMKWLSKCESERII